MKNADVLIIGSGISSLTCAALLSKKGKSVIVLEQHSKSGGYLHCFSRFGERFDTGAHYVGAMDPGQPFHTLLSYLGVLDDSLFTPLDPTGFDEFHYPDFNLKFPKGYDALIQMLCQEFPREKSAILKYFDLVQRAVKHFPTYEFSDVADTPTWALDTPLSAVVTELTSDRRLQCALYAYCALHGVAPTDIGFGFHAIVTDSLIRGPYGLASGGDALAQRFVQKIEECGGVVHTRKKVTRLEIKDRNVIMAVTESGECFSGDWVISGIHPKATLRLLSDSSAMTPAFQERVSSLQESVGLLGIYATCPVDESPFNPLRNYYFFSSDDPMGFLQWDKPTSSTTAAFVTSAMRSPKSTSKSGMHPINIHSACPISWCEPWLDSKFGERPERYVDLKATASDQTLGLIEGYFPGFRSAIKNVAVSTPLTNLHFNGSEEGSAYGIYHSIANTGIRALGPRTKVLNLLLTGQSSLFPGLLGAATSGLRTAGQIIGIKPILNELRSLRGRL